LSSAPARGCGGRYLMTPHSVSALPTLNSSSGQDRRCPHLPRPSRRARRRDGRAGEPGTRHPSGKTTPRARPVLDP